MYECLEDADPNDDLTIDELVTTLLRAGFIDNTLADDLRERYDDVGTGDTQAVFCQFWRTHEMEGDPLHILSELELV